MLKHFQIQRHQSVRLLVAQTLFAAAIGLALGLAASLAAGLAFSVGAFAVSVGQFAQSWLTFSGGLQNARNWFGRFLLGVLLKWLLVFTIMLLGMPYIAKAPLPALLGFVFSLLIIQLYNYFDAKVKRGS
jgi:zinc transporter ZupT